MEFVSIYLGWDMVPVIDEVGLPTIRVLHENIPAANAEEWLEFYREVYR